jgi:hypothetical protein
MHYCFQEIHIRLLVFHLFFLDMILGYAQTKLKHRIIDAQWQLETHI